LTNDERESDYNELLHHIQRDINEDRATSPAKEEKKKVYIAQLLLGYVKLNLSYIKSSKAKRDSLPSEETSNTDSSEDFPGFSRKTETPTATIPDARKGNDDATYELYRRWSEGVYDEAATDAEARAARNLPNLISTVFPAITGAPIRLQGKTLEHVFEGGSEIVTSLRNYYVNEILRQIYKIIGSLDFVGNPTMVVSSFLTGVRDFFIQPTREFSKDPSRIGVGVAKGTLSLISHSASGIFGFASKMSATAGQAAAQLSFDDYYKQWHEEHAVSEDRYKGNRKTRQIVADGIIRPAQDVVFGFLFAASGVMVEPYRGFKKKRLVGFGKGVAIGTVGVVTKPLVGIFDGFAHFTEAIHDLAKDINVLEKKFQPAEKRRLPYVFGTKDLLISFDLVSARSMQLLKQFPLRPESGSEVLVNAEVLHMEPGIDLYIVVSTKRTVLFKSRFEGSGQIVPSLLWQMVRESGVEIKSSIESRGHNGIALYVTSLEQGNGAGRRLESELNIENDDISAIPDYSPNIEVNEATSPPLRRNFSINSFGMNEWDLGDGLGTEDADHSRANLDADRSFFVAANANVKSAAKAIVQGAGAMVPLPRNHFSPLARGSSSNRGKIFDQHIVLGEFQHRQALIRVHNAISCLAGRFDLIMWEGGVGVEGSAEGYTSFGHLIFENKTSDTQEATDGTGRADDDFPQSLEETGWLHDVDAVSLEDGAKKHPAVTKIVSRNEWLYADELDSSRKEGGPPWLIQARARSVFVPPSPPPIPAHVDQDDEIIESTLQRLHAGSISYVQAVENIRARALELEETNRIDQASAEVDGVLEAVEATPAEQEIAAQLSGDSTETIQAQVQSAESVDEDISAHDLSFEDASAELTVEANDDSTAVQLVRAAATEATSLQSMSDLSRVMSIDARLDRLVGLLEQIVAFPPHANPLLNRSNIASAVSPYDPNMGIPPIPSTSQTSMVSTVSGIGGFRDDTDSAESETARLRREIRMLRRELEQVRAREAEERRRREDHERRLREEAAIRRREEEEEEARRREEEARIRQSEEDARRQREEAARRRRGEGFRELGGTSK